MPEKLSPRTRGGLVALGEVIRLARRAQGISRKGLAATVGMHIANYAKIEQGKKNVTYDTLLRIADGLGLELSIEFAESKGRRRSSRA